MIKILNLITFHMLPHSPVPVNAVCQDFFGLFGSIPPFVRQKTSQPSTQSYPTNLFLVSFFTAASWQMYLGPLHGTDNVPLMPPLQKKRITAAFLIRIPASASSTHSEVETIAYVIKHAEAGVDIEFHLFPDSLSRV